MVFEDLEIVENNDIGFLLGKYNIAMSFCITTLSVVMFTLKRKTATKFCNKLYEIDKILQHLNTVHRQKKTSMKLKFLIISVIFCSCGAVIGYISLYSMEIDLWFVIIDDQLVTWVIVEYVGIVAFMTTIAEQINEQFRSFYKNSEMSQSVFSITVVEAKNTKKDFRTDSNNDVEIFATRLAKLRSLQVIWIMFIDEVTTFVDFYGIIVLCCGFKFFYSILTDSYIAIEPALREKKFIMANFYDFFNCFYVLWDVMFLLIMTSAVTKLSKEVRMDSLTL